MVRILFSDRLHVYIFIGRKNLTEKLKAQNSSSAFSAPDIKNIMNTVKSRISEDSSHNERKVTFMHFKKRFVAVALCAVLVLGITAFAAEYGDNILKRITTGSGKGRVCISKYTYMGKR